MRRGDDPLRQRTGFFSLDPDPYLKGLPDEMFFEVADGFDCSDSGAEWDRILYFTRFMGVSVAEWFQMPVRRQRKFLVAFNYHIEKHPLSTL